jgi:ADP-ribose pyrophosphatase
MSTMNQPEGSRGEVVFAGKLLTVRREPVHHADGSVSLYEIVDHPDAVAVVALRQVDGIDRGESSRPDSTWLVALVRQMRPAIGKETLELPAGLVDDDEGDQPERTAVRELAEETGWGAGKWQLLTRHYPSPGFSTEAIWIYLARELQPIAGASPDSHEITGVEWLSLDRAIALCRDGSIDDGKTIAGLFLAAESLRVDGDR